MKGMGKEAGTLSGRHSVSRTDCSHLKAGSQVSLSVIERESNLGSFHINFEGLGYLLI